MEKDNTNNDSSGSLAESTSRGDMIDINSENSILLNTMKDIAVLLKEMRDDNRLLKKLFLEQSRVSSGNYRVDPVPNEGSGESPSMPIAEHLGYPVLDGPFTPVGNIDGSDHDANLTAGQRTRSNDYTASHNSRERQRCRPHSNGHQRDAYISSRPKLATYDGREDWDSFILPFERIAHRRNWTAEGILDTLHECLRGPAAKYVSTLPETLRENYDALRLSLTGRFGKSEPPTTARKRLSTMRQQSETLEEFGEEIRRVVSSAYPGMPLHMQDEIAAESLLKGLKNKKIAFEALNQRPLTLHDAIDKVITLEHNFSATMGRDYDSKPARRVSWSESSSPELPTPSKLDSSDQRLQRIEATLQRLSDIVLENKHPASHSREANTPQVRMKCYNCGEMGHMRRNCSRSRTPSPTVKWDHFHRYQSPGNKEEATVPVINVIRLTELCRSLTISTLINGVERVAVVDTGADATIISTETAQILGIRPGTERVKLLNAESDAEMTATGGVTVTIQLGEDCWKWPVYIAPIRDDVLLGMDFLKSVDAKIVAKQGDLMINGKWIHGASAVRGKQTVLRRVELAQDQWIPSSSPTIVMGRIIHPNDQCLTDGVHTGSLTMRSDCSPGLPEEFHEAERKVS